MAVQSDTSRIQYAGNNSTTTSYAVPFVFQENAHLKAIARTSAGVESVVTLTNHTGAGNVNGGTVRTAVAVPTTSTLTIYREVPITQTTSYAEGGDFPAASHERALDKLTQITQQLNNRINTCVRGSEVTPVAPIPTPTGTEQFVLAATAVQSPAWVPQSAIAVGPITATGSTAPRFVSDRFADLVNAKDFGVVGNGVADDTAAFVNAMAFCRANNKILNVEGNVIFNLASVPSGSIVLTAYVNGCSMVGSGNATITMTGAVGFNMTGVTDTLVENIRFVTSGRERTESSSTSGQVYVFYSGAGSKNSAVYRNLAFIHGVTSTTGEYRAGPTLREEGCSRAFFENISATNTVGVLSVLSSTNVSIENIYGSNIETNVYLSIVTDYSVKNCHHINTKEQADYWVGRTNASPRQINGMDNLLVEQGNRGVVSGLVTVWAHERAVYAQSSNFTISQCWALNTDGYKIVGNAYNDRVKNIYLNDCHLDVDDDWASTRGRGNLQMSSFYWASDIYMSSCSMTNSRISLINARALVVIASQGGATVSNLIVKNCTAINVAQLVMADMCALTAAQLVALTPAGSFYVAENVVIEGCFYKSNVSRQLGAIYSHRDNDASADAKATYATKNLFIANNVLELNPTAADRDDWFFDFRYQDGVNCTDNNPNVFFVGSGLFSTAISAPHQNIFMREMNLKHSQGAGTLVTRLGNFNLLRNSVLRFSGISSNNANVVAVITSHNTKDGKPNEGLVTIDVAGTGFYGVSTTDTYSVEMMANGEHYLGEVVSGTTRIDQLSTVLSGSATYDPASLNDGDGATTTVTVTGAALGDYAEVSFSLNLQGITVTAWVSAADTVSVRFQNETGTTINLGSGTLRARAFKTAPPIGIGVGGAGIIDIRGDLAPTVFYRVKLTKLS